MKVYMFDDEINREYIFPVRRSFYVASFLNEVHRALLAVNVAPFAVSLFVCLFSTYNPPACLLTSL